MVNGWGWRMNVETLFMLFNAEDEHVHMYILMGDFRQGPGWARAPVELVLAPPCAEQPMI